ncbi:hypothetical protein cce_4954 [Crocosphaera subtropica ATCC 51142]|uniref:Uncharacterized protein n=1 Tax=Crocosphaera subtropica (strain ATCC 51142 / BH68) TaxID=43989 RepID=B1X2D9_CROS5|nr:hypothetical protein [Crocosphaera subtropica]ACB54300.1 hypothetical protein cce_4954 [Crocosphaera subtropica ATCC 51142]
MLTAETTSKKLASIEKVEEILKRTETKRFLLGIWIEYPEIKSLTFEDTYEYDDKGSYYRYTFINQIEFISQEAKSALHERLDPDSIFDEEPEDWKEMLFEGIQPSVDPESMLETFDRPEDPQKELDDLIAEISQVIATAGGIV